MGPGTVTASVTGSAPPNCYPEVFMNGDRVDYITIGDGDTVAIELKSSGGCQCCEVERDCTVQTSSLWVQKSSKENKTIVMDRNAIREKVQLAVDRVRRRRRQN